MTVQPPHAIQRKRIPKSVLIFTACLLLLPLLFVLLHVWICFTSSLPLPCPSNGMVIEKLTGKPIARAEVTFRWQIYDYPMLDGGGSFPHEVTLKSDEQGRFALPLPTSQRPGFWKTESYPPTIRAEGFQPVTYTDWPSCSREEAGIVIIEMISD
jgi:hypothetical protein